MTRDALADRFLSYGDAMAAFAMVQTIAFSIALAEPDIRCSIANVWPAVTFGNTLFTALVSVCLLLLRRMELAMRTQTAVDPMVASYLRRLHVGRYVVVWLALALSLLSVYSSTFDAACPTG